jgi:hypothetical protein
MFEYYARELATLGCSNSQALLLLTCSTARHASPNLCMRLTPATSREALHGYGKKEVKVEEGAERREGFEKCVESSVGANAMPISLSYEIDALVATSVKHLVPDLAKKRKRLAKTVAKLSERN